MLAPDQSERLKALNPAQSFIVQAPAGSGKTELLTGRFLTLLANVRYPEEVVAITFTRKAAMEMQMRILSALQRAKLGQEPEAPHEQLNYRLAKAALERDEEQGWHLLDNPQRMRISTIDSLAAQITAQLPITAHFGEHFSVTEDAGQLYEQAINQLISSLRDDMPWVPALERLLLYLDNRLDIVKNLLKQMLARREMWLDIVVSASGHDDLKPILEQSVRTIVEEGLSHVLAQMPWEFEEDIKSLFEFSVGEALVLDEQIDTLPQWKKLAAWLLTDSGTVRKVVDKRQGFLPKTDEKLRMMELLKALPSHLGFVEKLNMVKMLPNPEYDEGTWQITADLLEVLKALSAFLRMTFKSLSAVDFNEIALLALDTLGPEDAPTDVMLQLDHRVSHLLVDEYQDTSLLQYRLFSAMTRGWQKDDGRTLFLVGDPMQSIYRFRQAEVSLFIKTIEEGLNGRPLEFVRLTANFRSQAGVIDWINHHFVSLFPAVSDPVNGAVAYSASQSIHAAEENPVVVDLSLDQVDEQISALVSRLQARRQINPQETQAILVRSRSHLRIILPALTQACLPYHGVEIEQLSERAVIQDLLSLTYAVYQLDDRLSWMAVLRSPMFGLTLSELLSISNEQNVIDELAQSPHQAVQRALPLFEQAILKRHRDSVMSVIRALWLGLQGPACLSESSDVDNAERFFDCLRDLNPAHQLPEREALELKLNKLYAERVPEADNPISIMTIHKAKGLEFDCVALPMLQQGTRAEDQPLLLWQDLSHMGRHELMIAPHHGADRKPNELYEFLFALEKDKSAKESVRLFYVAATRAKKQLILTGTVFQNAKEQIRAPKSGSLLSLLAPMLDLESCLIDSTAAPVDEAPVLLKSLPVDWLAGQAVQSLFLPEEKEDFNHPEARHWDAYSQRVVGTIVHQYLELIAKQGMLTWDIKQISQSLKSAGVSDIELNAGKVVFALEATLKDDIGRWILTDHPDAKSEWMLTESRGGQCRQFIIDRSFVAQGTRWIIDYKTSIPAEGEDLQAFLAAQKAEYEPQLNNYARLVRGIDQAQYPVQCMLYFPLIQTEVSWAYESAKVTSVS